MSYETRGNSKMRFDFEKKPDRENCDKFSNSAVIENSGNSKNCISFRSSSKSKTESTVKADAEQEQEQEIDF